MLVAKQNQIVNPQKFKEREQIKHNYTQEKLNKKFNPKTLTFQIRKVK